MKVPYHGGQPCNITALHCFGILYLPLLATCECGEPQLQTGRGEVASFPFEITLWLLRGEERESSPRP
uniref:Uncharacterized protein n=1 Tax=Setaria viridis TaxID=4556 RepID=A0A4U6TE66_SETVI|nr:hypothetical protein SEVIR_8G110550v2 [Setaria viridis]